MGAAEAGGTMGMVLWASPPAGSSDRRKKEGRVAEMISLRLWLMLVGEIIPTTFYAPVGTIEGDRHTKDRVP